MSPEPKELELSYTPHTFILDALPSPEVMRTQENYATDHPMWLVYVPNRMGYDAFLGLFFTEVAANRFMERNRHNHKCMKKYVVSCYGNPEMKAVRHLLTTREV